MNVLEGLQSYIGNGPIGITHLPAPPKDATEEQLVRDADVAIVVVGLTSEHEGEAQIAFGNRASLDLPAGQREWIRAIAPLRHFCPTLRPGSFERAATVRSSPWP